MPPTHTPRSRVAVEVPWRTILKLICAAALIWAGLQIISLALVTIVAVLLAVSLDPVVSWLQERGLSRGSAASIVGLALMALVAGFLWLTWASLADQAQFAASYLDDYVRDALNRLPAWMRNAIEARGGSDLPSMAASYAVTLSSSVMNAIAITLLGFIVMLYLLIEGRSTRDWLLAFVAPRHRGRAEQTMIECQRVTFAYVAGNVITSIIAFVCTLVGLWLLHVPAALLLALMAGLSDFVPVIGFVVSSIPAVLLGLTVSPTTGLLVVALYVAYNTVENYLITPWAYGDRMKLSNLAVILAFVIGAQVAGVIGALIALPVAAIYPAIERIWLRQQVGEETVREHQAIEDGE